MFCPNCGTKNVDTATTCSKCGFNIKGAAAPKFKGTMLMMNPPGGKAPVPPAAEAENKAPPPAPPAPTPGTAPANAGPRAAGPGGAPGGRGAFKGTMVGVAPPGGFGAGAKPAAPAAADTQAYSPPAQPAPAAHGFPAQSPAAQGPGGQGGATARGPGPYQAPAQERVVARGGQDQGPVNPLGGTMALDQFPGVPPPGYAGAPQGYGAPPGPPQGYGAPPGPPQGYAPAPGYGAPPPAAGPQGYGAPPAGQGYGAPPAGQGYGPPPPQGAPLGYGPPDAPPPQGQDWRPGHYGAPPGPAPAYAPPGFGPGAQVQGQYGQPGLRDNYAPDASYGSPPGYGAPQYGAHGGAMVPGGAGALAPTGPGGITGSRGAVRNPTMVTLLTYVTCGLYGVVALYAMMSELKAYLNKEEIVPWHIFVPVLGLIVAVTKLPAWVTEAKQRAGSPNPQSAGPIMYFLLLPYFLTKDLNEVWDPAGLGATA